MAQPKGFPLKLLVDGKTNKVVIAEAGKELVDFFFSLMQLPLGGAVSLLGKSFPGSMWELHNSIKNLNSSYFSAALHASSSEVKDDLTSPPFPFLSPRPGALHLPCWNNRTRQLRVYSCDRCAKHVSDVQRAECPSCPWGEMKQEGTFVLSSAVPKEKGLVKEMVPYSITDDLSIVPLSTVDILALMKRLEVNQHAPLEERTVVVGIDQCIRILEIYLRSKTVLSDVFLLKDEALKKTDLYNLIDEH